MKSFFVVFFYLIYFHDCSSQQLKSVIYDFDGQDIGATDLPDGDYNNFDLSYEVVANPISSGTALGDRVLKVDLNWSLGKGEFGKGISRYIELSTSADHLSFYIYNPLSNNSSAEAEVVIKEDDNSNHVYESSLDDKWSSTVIIPRSAGWQLVSVPLSLLTDTNTGGNGVFDAAYTADAGMVLIVGITFKKTILPSSAETYFLDMISFSEGSLPVGSTITDLPPSTPGDQCLLGVLAYSSPADSVPSEVEALFTSGKKLDYVNVFMSYAYSGTVPNALPGASIQGLIDEGYRPIITWESMYTSFAPLDPVQPRLNDLVSGSFDAYMDDFADRIKTYSDTVIIRLFHEFDGDWYPWSITENADDPNLLINAFRYIVNRFNARGVTNVLWAWSPNSNPSPSRFYNWSVFAYPGDAYVNIVGTSVYNHPIAGIPPWRSFRSVFAETYYYLNTYFPSKPLFIFESACRERDATELNGSQTKGEWICQSSLDLQSYFSRTKALVFFSTIKSHDWRINSSAEALQAINDCFWEVPYYSETVTSSTDFVSEKTLRVFPNPFSEVVTIIPDGITSDYVVRVFDMCGRKLLESKQAGPAKIGGALRPGIYLIELQEGKLYRRMKVIKN
ncbi:MAG: T9SS type A sorting domain-containing protein [Bacteroidota bacterium]|nr:T9SS type A sorting domain-containing protein [Bacteroidota bacterium]